MGGFMIPNLEDITTLNTIIDTNSICTYHCKFVRYSQYFLRSFIYTCLVSWPAMSHTSNIKLFPWRDLHLRSDRLEDVIMVTLSFSFPSKVPEGLGLGRKYSRLPPPRPNCTCGFLSNQRRDKWKSYNTWRMVVQSAVQSHIRRSLKLIEEARPFCAWSSSVLCINHL